jgi:hypothetical protein
LRNFLKQKNPQEIALNRKTRMKIFGLPVDFPETEKALGIPMNFFPQKNLQETGPAQAQSK